MSRSRVGSIVIRCLLLAAAILASCSNGFAQVASSISGRIEDPSGAGISGVNVTVRNLETDVTRTAVADATGNYQVLSLPIGQ